MDLDQLEVNGWCDFFGNYEYLEEAILDCGASLGRPIAARGDELVQELCPIATDEAFPRSLSALFGQGSFPFHVDTAHWTTPCHYIVLGCVEPGRDVRPTLLIDSRKLELTLEERLLLETTPIRIRCGRGSFYGTILSPDRRFIRYDPGCMEPMCSRGEEALKLLATERWSELEERIIWRKGRVVVIDNWRMLHGRASAGANDSPRKLLRVLVK